MRGFGSRVYVLTVVLAVCVLSQDVHVSENVVNVLGSQDTTSVLMAQLLSILDRLSSLDQRINSLNQRFDNVDQRLNSLDQRVEGHVKDLKERLERLENNPGPRTTTIMPGLIPVSSDSSDVNVNVTSSGGDVEPQSTQQPDVPFRITRIEKTELVDSYRVKMMYESSTRPKIFVPGNDVQLPEQYEPGVAEFNVSKQSLQDNAVVIYIALPDHVVETLLDFRNNSDYMDIPRLQVQVIPGRDLRFQPGQDVEFEVFYDIDGDLASFDEDLSFYQILVESNTRENVIDYYTSSLQSRSSEAIPAQLNVVEEGGSKAHRYVKLALNSTRENLEGIIQMTLIIDFNCSRNCLLGYLHYIFDLKFYLEEHAGPFPKDFIGFIHDFEKQNSSQTYCAVNLYYCYITCGAIGDGLSDIEISKMTSPDEIQPTPDTGMVFGDFGNSLLEFPNVTFEDAGHFLCTARSEKREITEQLQLVVVRSPTIDRELSTMTKMENGSVLYTCVAEGIPAPNITIEDFPYSDIPNPIPQPHVTHPTPTQTRAELIIEDPHLLGPSYGMFCRAANGNPQVYAEGYFYDSYRFGDSPF